MNYLTTPQNIAIVIIIAIIFICFLKMLYLYFEAKQEEREIRRMFYTPEEKQRIIKARPVKRYNTQLNEIETELIHLT